jgi:hypothetical protein
MYPYWAEYISRIISETMRTARRYVRHYLIGFGIIIHLLAIIVALS